MLNESTINMLARLREAEAALDALDQIGGPGCDRIVFDARRAYALLDKAVKGAVDDWNGDLEPGDRAVYRCADADDDGFRGGCERWTDEQPEGGVAHCVPCAERAYDRAHA